MPGSQPRLLGSLETATRRFPKGNCGIPLSNSRQSDKLRGPAPLGNKHTANRKLFFYWFNMVSPCPQHPSKMHQRVNTKLSRVPCLVLLLLLLKGNQHETTTGAKYCPSETNLTKARRRKAQKGNTSIRYIRYKPLATHFCFPSGPETGSKAHCLSHLLNTRY